MKSRKIDILKMHFDGETGSQRTIHYSLIMKLSANGVSKLLLVDSTLRIFDEGENLNSSWRSCLVSLRKGTLVTGTIDFIKRVFINGSCSYLVFHGSRTIYVLPVLLPNSSMPNLYFPSSAKNTSTNFFTLIGNICSIMETHPEGNYASAEFDKSVYKCRSETSATIF